MIKILVKNRFRALIGAAVGRGKRGTVKNAGTLSKVATVLLYAFVALIFASFSAGMAYLLGSSLLPIGADWLYFAVFILASLAIVFILSIFETKSELFECKDNELLLSMPIKPKDIVVARVLVVLAYNYIEQLIIMLPCTVVYIAYTPSAEGIVGSLLMTLFLPIISTALSAGVGYLVALISKKIRKNSFVTVAIFLVFFFLYFVGYNAILNNFEEFLDGAANGVDSSRLPVLYYIGTAALLKPLSLISVIGVALLLGITAYLLITRSYMGLLVDTSYGKRVAYKGISFKQKGTLGALVTKELRKFVSSATYMLNAGIGLVMTLGIAIYALIKRDFLLSLAAQFAEEGAKYTFAEIISPLAVAALVFMTSMNIMSACALSLEGKNFWIPKTMPVSARTVLLSKSLPQIIIGTPPMLLASVLIMIALGAPSEYWFFFIVTPILANALCAFMGIVINVAFPKFDFDNETQPIKQSLPVFLVMMIGMLASVAVFVGVALLMPRLNPLVICALVFAFYAALVALFYLLLLGPAAKRYDRLDV